MSDQAPSLFNVIASVLTFGAAALAFIQGLRNKGKLEEIHVLVDGRLEEALDKIKSLEKRINTLKTDPEAEDAK